MGFFFQIPMLKKALCSMPHLSTLITRSLWRYHRETRKMSQKNYHFGHVWRSAGYWEDWIVPRNQLIGSFPGNARPSGTGETCVTYGWNTRDQHKRGTKRLVCGKSSSLFRKLRVSLNCSCFRSPFFVHVFYNQPCSRLCSPQTHCSFRLYRGIGPHSLAIGCLSRLRVWCGVITLTLLKWQVGR